MVFLNMPVHFTKKTKRFFWPAVPTCCEYVVKTTKPELKSTVTGHIDCTLTILITRYFLTTKEIYAIVVLSSALETLYSL